MNRTIVTVPKRKGSKRRVRAELLTVSTCGRYAKIRRVDRVRDTYAKMCEIVTDCS